MYIVELKEGQIVPIFRDHQNEEQFEGYAKLIRKKSEGNTYSLDEKLFKISLNENPLKRKYAEEEMNLKYFRLQELLSSETPQVMSFKEVIFKIVAKKKKVKGVYNRVFLAIAKIKGMYVSTEKKYLTPYYKTSVMKTIFDEYPIQYLTLYCIQSIYPEKTASLFIDERWDVEFFPQNNPFKPNEILYFNSFTTTRKIKILSEETPDDDDISSYTTYDTRSYGKSSHHEFKKKMSKDKD